MNVDYIVVGCGLAGISFCEQLKANGKSFVVFDNQSQQSSIVAGGLYNPVVLKRFTSVWESKEQLELALPMYANLEKQLKIKLDYKIPVLRRFASIEEQNNWFTASDKPNLNDYLSTKLIPNENTSIDAPFGFGKVLQTGRIDTRRLVNSYKEDLIGKNQLAQEVFVYDALQIKESTCQYQEIVSNRIVFTEGFGVKQNPFFNIPLKQSKGELITIHAPDLKIDFVLKAGVFIFPLGKDLYRVGATYEWKDETNCITQKAKEELLNKLKTVVNCDFKVVDQVAGIRPTIVDRRPVVGKHTEINNMYILNGLGTRGVMIGPYVAKQLYNFIENKEPLEKEIDLNRFNKN